MACSLFPLIFLLLVFYLLCATLEWPQNMEANEKAGIGWVLICQRGVHFRGSARSWRSHLPPCEDASELLSLRWWVIWNYFQHAYKGRWKMTPHTKKGLHAKTSLLSLCLTDNHPPPAVFPHVPSFCTLSCFNTKVLIIRLFLACSCFHSLPSSVPLRSALC